MPHAQRYHIGTRVCAALFDKVFGSFGLLGVKYYTTAMARKNEDRREGCTTVTDGKKVEELNIARISSSVLASIRTRGIL